MKKKYFIINGNKNGNRIWTETSGGFQIVYVYVQYPVYSTTIKNNSYCIINNNFNKED